MINISEEHCKENQNTFYVQYLFSENRTVYEIMCKNMVETERPKMTIYYGSCAVYAG
jgi:hypothetical protein